MTHQIVSRLLAGSILWIFALAPASYPQTRKSIESFPKVLSVREQQAVRETWLKKRLDTMLLPMMRQEKIEMWIVTIQSN
jgi:hypothetical protein